MATRVKQLVVGVAALAALGCIGAGSAAAQTVTTTTAPAATATFASPASAPANQPMWVRSITPCPVPTPGVASVVVARIVDEVLGGEIAVSATEVRSDGHWDATVVAPSGPLGDGTIGFLVEAQCLTRERVPDAETIVRQKYVLRPLDVTSGASGASLGWLDAPVGGVVTTTTTTTAPPTTTTTVASGGSQPPGFNQGASVTPTTSGVPTKSSYVAASDVQAEITKKAAIAEVRRTSDVADQIALNASPTSATRVPESSDAGIPAWSFACAAALAVGAVVAWGQRRSAPVEIDE